MLESEVFKPVVLWLLDPEQEPIPAAQVSKALDVLESWLVRRMLVRATTKSTHQIAAELVTQLRKVRAALGRRRRRGLLRRPVGRQPLLARRQRSHSGTATLLAYQRLRRGRAPHGAGGDRGPPSRLARRRRRPGGERVARGKFHIEHVMPRKWQAHWPLPATALAS